MPSVVKVHDRRTT